MAYIIIMYLISHQLQYGLYEQRVLLQISNDQMRISVPAFNPREIISHAPSCDFHFVECEDCISRCRKIKGAISRLNLLNAKRSHSHTAIRSRLQSQRGVLLTCIQVHSAAAALTAASLWCSVSLITDLVIIDGERRWSGGMTWRTIVTIL